MTFDILLPLACAWAEEQESLILREGVALTPSQLEDARRIGVVSPERVKLRVVDAIPLPVQPLLRGAAETTGLISLLTCGLTLRYGIYIRSDQWGVRRLVVHELAHTAQYERLGSIRAFLECYLYECLAIGYTAAPMEQEAIAMVQRICGRVQSPGIPQAPLPNVSTRKPTGRGPRTHT